MLRAMPAFILGVLVLTVGFSFQKISANTKYGVFCADGKIEVDMRSLEQMKSARGSNVCLLQDFDYSSDADNHAQSLGGKGAACSCN